MKKAIWLVLLMVCAGCITVKVPKYLKDEFPYQKKFYASFDDTLAATQKALRDTGWRISEIASPSTFEQGQPSSDTQGRQILIFTEIRQTPLILASRYMSLNVYLRTADNSTDVEIRYISVVPVLLKNSTSYKNDVVVNRVFDRISELLTK